jgi:hypothetical protein
MDRWLVWMIKKPVKTPVIVPEIAVEASTANRYVQILSDMQLFYLFLLLSEVMSVEHISIFVF